MGSCYHTSTIDHLPVCPFCLSKPCYWIDAWSPFCQAECDSCWLEAEVLQFSDDDKVRQIMADNAWILMVSRVHKERRDERRLIRPAGMIQAAWDERALRKMLPNPTAISSTKGRL